MIDVEAVVVDSLDAVDASVLIGGDVISGAGGVHLEYQDTRAVCDLVLDPRSPLVFPAAVCPDVHPSPHVKVSRESNGDVLLTASDGEVRWCAEAEYWELRWAWKCNPPCEPLGHGVGEYSRAKLTDQQELLFQAEVDQWIENEWLVPHDEEKHGKTCCCSAPPGPGSGAQGDHTCATVSRLPLP